MRISPQLISAFAYSVDTFSLPLMRFIVKAALIWETAAREAKSVSLCKRFKKMRLFLRFKAVERVGFAIKWRLRFMHDRDLA